MTGFGVRWHQFRDSRDPASFRILLLLAALAIGLGLYLITGPKPWDNSIVKRLAAGRDLKLDQFIQIGVWWGAAAGLVGALLGVATLRLWSRPHIGVYPDLCPPSRKAIRWTWLLVLAATLLAIAPRVARLDHSLWNDEEMHLRYYVVGDYEPTADGSLAFDPVTLKESVFFNKKGNNHFWSSFEVRAGHFLSGHDWSSGSGFSEAGLRAAPFVSALLTVAALVLLGAALGSARAGLAAGIILALHPWHVRWSVEIRGYSTMLLAITAGLFCMVRALQTNRWRWWLGVSLTQAVFLLCFPGSAYVAVALNIVAGLCIVSSRTAWAIRWSSVFRLIVAGILALIPVALIIGPSVPQIAAYLAQDHEYAPINAAWFTDLWAHLVTGLRHTGDAPGHSAGLGVNDLTAAAPWRSWVIFGIIPVLSLTGLFFLFRQDWRTRLVAGTLLLAGILALAHNSLSGNAFVTWYLLYLIPLFALALAWAGQGLRSLNPAIPASLPLFIAVIFCLATAPALHKITAVPRQPIREVVNAMRGVSPALNNANPRILTASFGDGARQMISYDPRLHVLKSPADLATLTNLAASTQRPLFLCFRDREGMQKEEPQLLKALTGDPRWQRLPDIQGMEAMWSYELYRFAPDSVERIGLKP